MPVYKIADGRTLLNVMLLPNIESVISDLHIELLATG